MLIATMYNILNIKHDNKKIMRIKKYINRYGINMIFNNGITPLMLACQREDYIIANQLIESGVDVNTRDYYGYRTALHYISKLQCNPKVDYIVRQLITANADINVRDADNMTALHYACYNHNYSKDNTFYSL
jgi:ankyrin repeat protein